MKEVKVVSCPSFSNINLTSRKGRRIRKGNIWNSNLKDERSFGQKSKLKNDKNGNQKKKAVDEFNDAWKSVTDLGASQFTGKDKRSYEAKKALQLGAKAAKNEKVPYNILMKVKQGRKKKEAKEAVLAKSSGIVTGKRSRKENDSSNRKRKKPSFKDGGPVPNFGTVRNGILKVKISK
mmetsp:Transcript_8630/g.11387  ORF Transcript_8630/g.11387 Transcript_8630/m.11387 type:complete len:178 (+) Transcript_8630:41-574(+)|eukprot:CAMPEP_0117792658 /NCGR_PEP_ID=MMETSP0948-20121206/9573_1 /TAXON_ID=44440 /ORGANISM="Chattonella subsalsa, Strain CCMP2191" /LENGTH=177 /DNA_ID=CAMNT_0005622923 /DNA_START=28 /DNA_END=561 /DNA_ORIENTATION=+